MDRYESPKITTIGTVAELTQGQIFQQGQDSLSWIRIPGNGHGPGHGNGNGPGNGGGFGS